MHLFAILGIYLIFKGKELVSLAELRPENERETAVRNARQWFAASVLIGVTFTIFSVAMVEL